jgi:hypothetical protein
VKKPVNLLWPDKIPILAGSTGINQFLSDIGLDMFSDLVPWHSWDHEPDSATRLQKIIDFAESWIGSGSMLADYDRVMARVQANKRYFHSEAFRNRIMIQMSNLELG